MRTTKINGLCAKHAIITRQCILNRGVYEAFDEAAARLRDEYADIECGNSANSPKFHLVLTVDYPDWETERREEEGSDA